MNQEVMNVESVFEVKKDEIPPPSKQNRGEMEEWDSSREGESRSGSPLPSTGKRKAFTDRQPESPTDIDNHIQTSHFAKREKTMYRDRMETDSPSSYPRHVIVPSDSHPNQNGLNEVPYQESTPSRKNHGAPTPTLTPESMPMQDNMHGGPYEPHNYRPQGYYGSDSNYHNGGRPNTYSPEQEQGMGMYGQNYGQRDVFVRPKRWACDYCSVATFLSYEEACVHEEACARRHQDQYAARLNPRPPMRPFGNGPSAGGLGALYHATQEVGPMRWNNARGGPQMPVLPSERNHHMQNHLGYGDYRGYEEDYHYQQQHHHRHQPHHPRAAPEPRRGLLLALSTDTDSLSDRQCYVRTTMVEIFAATEKDVAARHTKGAQKLAVGQVGIRCVHCAHLRARDRAERAVCYPSSISRIYQTVADMQRFHFEQCTEIPNEIRDIYKSLKTTRPRGVGSPQTYWIQSAKLLGLIDSDDGIRFQNDEGMKQQSDMSV